MNSTSVHCNWGGYLPESWAEGLAPRNRGTELERRAFLDLAGNCLEYGKGKHLDDAERIRGFAYLLPGEEVWFSENDRKRLQCLKNGPRRPAVVHCYVQPEHSKIGITVGGNFRYPKYAHVSTCLTLYGHLLSSFPYGEEPERIEKVVGGLRYPAAEACDWPAR